MKYIVAIVCLAAVAIARPGGVQKKAAVAITRPGGVQQKDEPVPFNFHSTGDVDGSYSFSYAAEDSSKTESRDADGNVSGAFKYIDSEGVLQEWQYKAGVNGVQIQASNLAVGSTEPMVDTAEVLKATEEHFHAVQRAIQLIARAQKVREAYEKKLAARKAAAKKPATRNVAGHRH